MFCAGSTFFPQGCEPEVEQWQRHLSSEITISKGAIVHLVCVIIMYTIYEMYKDVASSRSSYAIFLKCRGRGRGQPEVALLPPVEMGTAPTFIPGYDVLLPIVRLYVYLDNCSWPIELQSRTYGCNLTKLCI